jgi:hypothetical protein
LNGVSIDPVRPSEPQTTPGAEISTVKRKIPRLTQCGILLGNQEQKNRICFSDPVGFAARFVILFSDIESLLDNVRNQELAIYSGATFLDQVVQRLTDLRIEIES